MMDVNSGYIGYSMSRRAAEAYEDGEMPKSKWTKKAMVAAIQSYCDEFDMLFDPDLLKGMHKDEVFERFFYESSWHHTSKFFNETDFYKLDEDAVCGSFRPMNPTEVAERDAVRRQAIEEEKAVREAMRAAENERLDRWTVTSHTEKNMDSVPRRWPRSPMSTPSAARSASTARATASSPTSTASGMSRCAPLSASAKRICTASMRPNRAASTGQSSVTSYTTRGMPVTTLSPSREKPQP